MSLTYSYPGARSLLAHHVRQRNTTFALEAEWVTKSNKRPITQGDGKQNPDPIAITTIVDEHGIELTSDLTWTLIQEMADAVYIAWHEGTMDVDGILWHEVREAGGTALRLNTAFAPASTLNART